jgi:hypothetical protein
MQMRTNEQDIGEKLGLLNTDEGARDFTVKPYPLVEQISPDPLDSKLKIRLHHTNEFSWKEPDLDFARELIQKRIDAIKDDPKLKEHFPGFTKEGEKPSLSEVLALTMQLVIRHSGIHNEKLYFTPKGIHDVLGDQLIPEDRPPTKCSFFNEAYRELFYLICEDYNFDLLTYY